MWYRHWGVEGGRGQGVHQNAILAQKAVIGLALELPPGAGQWRVPRKATGRVASMPRLRSSLESTDPDPMVGEDWGLSPLPEPKEPETKPRRHSHFVAGKQLLS